MQPNSRSSVEKYLPVQCRPRWSFSENLPVPFLSRVTSLGNASVLCHPKEFILKILSALPTVFSQPFSSSHAGTASTPCASSSPVQPQSVDRIDLPDLPCPSLHLSKLTSRLRLGTSPLRLHLGPPSLQLGQAPAGSTLVSCWFACATYFWAFRYASSLHPFGSVCLLLPSGSTLVIGRSAFSSVLYHPSSTAPPYPPGPSMLPGLISSSALPVTPPPRAQSRHSSP